MDFDAMREAYLRALNHAKEDISILDLYPTVITETRYSGVYEGGRWASFPSMDDERMLPEEAFGEDTECIDFWWSEKSLTIGRGETPNEAYMDMLDRIIKYGA
jgi:hypothetical protein